MIQYDASRNEVEIKYKYTLKGTRKNHIFNRTPIFLQYHPFEQYSSEAIRIHFEGHAPKWLDDYAHKKDYELIEFDNECVGEGFALIKKCNERVFELPTIKSTLMEMVDTLPEELQSFLEPLIDNIEVVAANLKSNHFDLAEKGFHYRSETLNGDSGAIYIEPMLSFPSNGSELDMERIEAFKNDWSPIVDVLVQEVSLESIEEVEAPTIDLPEELEDSVISSAVPSVSNKTEIEKPIMEIVEIDLPLLEASEDGLATEEEVVIIFEDPATESISEEIMTEEVVIVFEDDSIINAVEEVVPDIIVEEIEVEENSIEHTEVSDHVIITVVEAEQAIQEVTETKELVGIGAPVRAKKPRTTKSIVEGQQFLF